MLQSLMIGKCRPENEKLFINRLDFNSLQDIMDKFWIRIYYSDIANLDFIKILEIPAYSSRLDASI